MTMLCIDANIGYSPHNFSKIFILLSAKKADYNCNQLGRGIIIECTAKQSMQLLLNYVLKRA